jgi:hypothetical protein
MSIRALCVLPVTCLALLQAGCGKGADQPAGKAAGAEVLPGTISDAMINVDQSQSQPLLQPAPPSKTTAADAPDDAASDATAAPTN